MVRRANANHERNRQMETPAPTTKAILAAAIAAALGAALSVFADGSRAPIQDTFVHSGAAGTAYGNNAGIIVGNGREGCLMFDVSGLANVDSAKIKFHIAQCGTTAGVKWPLFFRVMRNDRWNEASLTYNTRPDEMQVYPSPLLSTNDASVAGYVEVPAGSQGSWQEVDVTEAVKAAAPRGRLALHVTTSWDGTSGDTTPLVFASSDNADATLRPYLEFTGAADASASTLTLVSIADTYVCKWDNNEHGGEEDATVDSTGREAFLKFDLAGIGAESVDSATLLLKLHAQCNDLVAGNNIEFRLTGLANWNESGMTWGNAESATGVVPGGSWDSEASADAVRGPTSAGNEFYSVELAPLVNRVLAAGGTTLSLNIRRNPSAPRYFDFYTKDCATDAWRPRLLVTPMVDAALTTRKPVQETFVGTYEKDTAYFPWMEDRNWDYLQIGCTGNNVEYGLMLFDPAGLDDAAYVRFRVRSRNTIAASAGAFRVAAWTTDRWNATNLTWNTTGPWFPQPESVADGTALDGEVASVKLVQSKAGNTYFEVDVTAAARAAAVAGRMLTLGLFSNNNWPEIFKGESGSPAVLLFPDPDAAFGNRVTASLDESGATPALRLAWSALPSGQGEYTVERQKGDGSWKTVASGLSESTCLDGTAEPGISHTYRITGYDAADGSSTVVEATVAFDAKKTVFACADTYVRNGGDANTTFGAAASLVHKYDNGDNSGGVREGFYRFDLSEMPERFTSATLKLFPTGPAGNGGANAHLDLLKYPDFEWSDANAPAWNGVFNNGWATPQAHGDSSNHPDSWRRNEISLGVYDYNTSGDLTPDVPVEFDVADAIKTAKANGEAHITLHTSTYSTGGWNFGFISRERSQGVSCAAQIEFTLKSWVANSFVISVR